MKRMIESFNEFVDKQTVNEKDTSAVQYSKPFHLMKIRDNVFDPVGNKIGIVFDFGRGEKELDQTVKRFGLIDEIPKEKKVGNFPWVAIDYGGADDKKVFAYDRNRDMEFRVFESEQLNENFSIGVGEVKLGTLEEFVRFVNFGTKHIMKSEIKRWFESSMGFKNSQESVDLYEGFKNETLAFRGYWADPKINKMFNREELVEIEYQLGKDLKGKPRVIYTYIE